MALSVCFSCGANKASPLELCSGCGEKPKNEAERVLSLGLSEHLSNKALLTEFSYEIQNQLKLSMHRDIITQAREALKDPQLMAMLAVCGEEIVNDSTESSRERMPASINATTNKHKSLNTSSLHNNPFFLLELTTRDNKKKIVEAAEEKLLDLEHDVCQKARAQLTNPRTRLAAEVDWLPGISPRKAILLLSQLLDSPYSLINETGLPTLAHLNLLTAAFAVVGEEDSIADITAFILQIAQLTDELNYNEILRDVNEDRCVSSFPAIKSIDQIESEIGERQRYYRNTIKEVLNKLSPTKLVQIMTEVVDAATENGEVQSFELINQLVDSYQVETQAFLLQEGENIEKLLAAIRSDAQSGEDAIKPLIDKLVSVTRNWDMVAQPIQLNAKSKGVEHEASNEIAYSIRNIGIELFNEHGLLTQAQRITELLQELFSELPELIDRVDEDANALEDIIHSRKHEEEQFDEWAEEITYSAEIGAVFKNRLAISPDGISWKNRIYPLKQISRVRWGGIRNSVNGIPTGTTFTIGFGDDRTETIVELKKKNIYSTFTEKLWRAVCVRLLTDILESLAKGEEIQFGGAVVRDHGVTLTKHKFLGSDEKLNFNWNQVQVWSSGGEFFIGIEGDKKTYASMSYISDSNVHILEQAIRMKFKAGNTLCLSDLLKEN